MTSVYSGIVQKLTPDIWDKIIRRFLAGIWGKITGENASNTPASPTRSTTEKQPRNTSEAVHIFSTDLETKPHFRKYIYIITIWILILISAIICVCLLPSNFSHILDIIPQISTIIINI